MTAQSHWLLIVNGKSAGRSDLREAIMAQRDAGRTITVRATWEGGDAADFAERASDWGATHVIACGGDGTVSEVMNGLMRQPHDRRLPLGIVPLGSANDFATSIGIPLEPGEALKALAEQEVHPIDVVKVTAQAKGDTSVSHYLNMATGGFGAEITSSTPKMLKRLLGGGAYSVMGAMKAWRHRSYRGTLHWEGEQRDVSLLLLAAGNGRQSGGGQVLAPRAKLDDGRIDVLLVQDFRSVAELPQLMQELQDFPADGRFVNYFSTRRLDVTTQNGDEPWPLTLDGEARQYDRFSLEVVPLALPLMLPEATALLSSRER